MAPRSGARNRGEHEAARRVLVAVAVLGAALVVLAASFLVGGSTLKSVQSGRVGPISGTTSPMHVPTGAPPGAYPLQTTHISFAFTLSRLVNDENVLQIGPTYQGIDVVVNKLDGQFYVTVQTDLDYEYRILVLVSHVEVHRTYSAQIDIGDSKVLAATVNGRQQFQFAYAAPQIQPRIGTVWVGSGAGGVFPLNGSVRHFSMSFTLFAPPRPTQVRDTLRLVALVGAATVFTVWGFSWLINAIEIGAAETRKRIRQSLAPATKWIAAHAGPVGLVCAAGGIALLAVLTPLDNTVLSSGGQQTVSLPGPAPVGSTAYAVAGAPNVWANFPSLDASLAFTLRLTSPLGRHHTETLVATGTHANGIAFQLTRSNALMGIVGGIPNIIGATERMLVKHVPVGAPLTVTAQVLRSQQVRYMVNGQTVQTFTWNLPIFQPAPANLMVNATHALSISNVQSTVRLYNGPSSQLQYVLVRIGQIAAFLLLVGGTILLAVRLLSGLVVAREARRKLVVTIFATSGAFTGLNVVIDLLHLQQSPQLYFERNTWLLSQFPRFNDFFQVFEIFRSLNPYGVQAGSYPPFGYWLVAPLILFGEYAALFIFIATTLGFLIWWIARTFGQGFGLWQQVLIVVAALSSLPVTFAFDRANVDIVLFIMIIIGVAALERRRGPLAATWLGLVAATKAVPIVYLFVFLRGRRLRFILMGVGVAVVATVGSIAAFRGSLTSNIHGFINAEAALEHQESNAILSTYFNASMYGWLQSIGFAVHGASGAQGIRNALAPLVTPIEVLATLALAWYLRVKETALWRALMLITLLLILFTALSNYYELLFLFVPIGIFAREAPVSRRSIVIAVLCGLILAPHAYFYLGSVIDVSVLITAPLLIALGVVVLYDGAIERRQEMLDRSLVPSL